MSPRIELLTAQELMEAEYKPTTWIVENFLARGKLTVLYGESGIGKSMLMLALACGVAGGGDVAGMACRQGRALIIDAENGERDTSSRGQWLGFSELSDRASLLYVDALDCDLDLSRVEYRRELSAHVERHQPVLVVVDSLTSCWGGDHVNDERGLVVFTKWLQRLARDNDAAVVLQHHPTKGGKAYKGTPVIKQQCDAMFALTWRHGWLRLDCEKARFPDEVPPRTLRLVKHDGRAFFEPGTATGGADRPTRPNGPTKAEIILEHVPVGEPMSLEAMLETLRSAGQGFSKSTLWRVLSKDLQPAKRATKTDRGWMIIDAKAVA